jgi:hypothetical protein
MAVLFFGMPVLQRRRAEEQLLYPNRIERYPDANVCLEFFRSKRAIDAGDTVDEVMVHCYHCECHLIARIPSSWKRQGEWVIRSRPLRGNVRCPRCKNTFVAKTEPLYFMTSPPTTTLPGAPAEAVE